MLKRKNRACVTKLLFKAQLFVVFNDPNYDYDPKRLTSLKDSSPCGKASSSELYSQKLEVRTNHKKCKD